MLPPNMVNIATVEMVCTIAGGQFGIAICLARATTDRCVVETVLAKSTRLVCTDLVVFFIAITFNNLVHNSRDLT